MRKLELSEDVFRTIVEALAEPWAMHATRAAIPLDAFCHPIGAGGYNLSHQRTNRQSYKRRAEKNRDDLALALASIGMTPLPMIDVASFIKPADPKTASARHLGYPEFHAEACREEKARLVADVLSLAGVALCRDAIRRIG